MIRSYFLVAWRNLLRNKVFSMINITGLAIGMTVVFMIYQYIQSERSYDTFNKNAAQLYRIPIEYTGALKAKPSATSHPSIGPALKQDFPEVKEFARLIRASLFFPASTFTYEKGAAQPITFNEERVFVADEALMSMFSFPFVEGDAAALKDPMTIVLTRKVAQRYFGAEPAVGKTLLLNRMPCKVTAVVDVPENSHLQFDVLISFASLGPKWGYSEWAWPEFYNYVQLVPGADPKALEAKFPAFMEKYSGKIWEQYKFKSHIWLQPITDIHLKSDMALEQSMNGSERVVYFLSLLGAFILGIAWINYINLSTAKALERSKEVGLRKVSGASRLQLITQFFFDAFLVNIIAVIVAVILSLVAIPFFESLTGKHISQILVSSGTFYTVSFWSWVIGTLLVGVLIVGLYPALLLSSFNPALVLKGKFTRSARGAALRKGMVVFQYVLSIFLVAGTVTMSSQMRFMEKQDLGYTKDQMLVIRASAIGDSTYETHVKHFTNMVKQLSQVDHMTSSGDVPGHTIAERNNIHRVSQDDKDNVGTFFITMDHEFLETYGMKVVAGRNLTETDRFLFVGRDQDQSKERLITDEGYLTSGAPNRIMINEALAESLGFDKPEDAIGERVSFELGRKFVGEITGVVKNHNQVSLHEKYQPIVYYYPSYDNWAYFSVHIDVQSGNVSQMIDKIGKLYAADFPNSAYEYFFMDDHFNKQYQNDIQFAKIFGTFTILAIIISSLGLLGLGIFNVAQRVKEIGIRRVLGSSTSGILLLFCKDSFWLVMISYAIALPVIFLGSKNWLDNFAFHIGMEWQMFLLPPALLLLISLVTIIFVTMKAAVTSPAVSLKTE